MKLGKAINATEVAMSKNVVIIGAGPGGLATAILLSKTGLNVKVLEKQGKVGGRTSSIESGGFKFDIGPTFFLFPQVLKSIYAALGRDLFKEIPMVRLDPQYHLVFGGGGEILARPDVPAMEKAIARISPADAKNFVRFLTENRVKLNQFKSTLETPFHGWRDLFKLQMLKLLPLLRPWKSLDSELARYFSDPRVRLAFSFQSKYLGMSPFNCPSLFSILSFLEYEHGVYHPIGGCSAVSEGMANLAREAGVEILLDQEVDGIEFQGRKPIAVNTRSGRHSCDKLVINADFGRAMERLIPEKIRPAWTNKKIEGKRFSCSTFMLYLGIEGRYDNLQHHTIYMSRDYQGNLKDIEKNHVLSEDPSFYIQNACITDPTLAPSGRSTLYVLVPVTHMHPNVNWEKEKVRYRNLAIRQLAKIGLHDVEKRICHEQITTPMDWQNNMEIYKGATFNLAHNLGQMLHFRPRNRFAELDGVYLVGGGTHPGSGLPVIYESARISSRLLLEDMGLPFDHCIPPTEYTLEDGVPDLLVQGAKKNLAKHEAPLVPMG